jgi:hypothetical protein
VLEVAFSSNARAAGTFRLDTSKIQNLTRLGPRSISITPRIDKSRRDIERLIEVAFAERFGSKVTQHYPVLMSVHGDDGGVLSAVGFRAAADEPLFLEQYLDGSIEASLSRHLGTPVTRDKIVEIGSLASAGSGASIFLFVALSAYLRARGFSHAVATATKSVRRVFQFFDFGVVELGTARRCALGDHGADWGSYYEHDPKVVAGAIGIGADRLRRYLPAVENDGLFEMFAGAR